MKSCGFTLIELLITILVAGILMTVAAPSFTSMLKDNRLLSQQSTFIAGLNLTRSEAVKRAHQVVICKSADNASCTTGDNWEDGWIIYADTDSNDALDGGEEILKVQSALSGSNTFRTNATTLANQVIYDSSGYLTVVGGSFALCDDRGDADGIAFVISTSGRARVTDIASSNVTCP